ncbi:MAG TPA: xanthine dehydrogenase family protein molybdopterin-binding subunit [Nocardioidaceae bacterium]|nr:xanthine dehydrogenase family protein molybdopterin-binding subunit [Nocardioidaceae bacterium]
MSIGEAVLRTEDHHLITGRTRWTANLAAAGSLHLVFVRSPVPHARITVNVDEARRQPDVVAVWTGGDLARWCPLLPSLGSEPPLALAATDVVRYVGEAVAVVAARTRAAAADAADTVEVDYEDLPVVTSVEAGLADGAPALHDGVEANTVQTLEINEGDVEAAFAAADVVVRRRFEQPRVFAAAMEPRAVSVQPDGDGFTVYLSTQVPHIVRASLAEGSGIPEEQLRVVAPDVGGGFGSKFFYPEELVVLLAARELGRPVSWSATRSEDLQSTFHGRAVVQEVAVAATAQGEITGLDVRLTGDSGGYVSPIGPGASLFGAQMYTGAYRIPTFRLAGRCVLTSKTPVGAYRGAGRPEATYAIERIVDELAAELGLDPVDVRRTNWIRPDQFPFKTAAGQTYDVGDYAATADRALELSGYAQWRKRQAAQNDEAATRRLGIGVSTYVEVCGGGVRYDPKAVEVAGVRLTPTGVEVTMGTTAYGTGHATSWAQIVSDVLGVDVRAVRVIQGDTGGAPHGFDSYGSRSLSVVGSALFQAAQEVRKQATEVAARLLEADPADLEFSAGSFAVRGTGAAKTIAEVALASYDDPTLVNEGYEPGLGCTRTTDLAISTFPFGAHIAVVEVDTETGRVQLLDYVAVDDVGNVVNPMIVDGQVQGGAVQGIAQALFEEVGYDDQANLVTASFADYAIPTAADVVNMRTDRLVTPSTTNPLGTKGVGEAGAIAAPPAVVNAVLDALRPLGVTEIAMPCTPERIWRAIQGARSAG